MLDIFARVIEKDRELIAVREALRELRRYEVLVGIPDDSADRHEKKEQRAGQELPVQRKPVTNAELLYIHTHGSLVRHIPARPVLEPAIEHDKEAISAELRKATEAALDGNLAGIAPALKRAGELGQKVARAWFVNPANGWKENSIITIEGTPKGKNGKRFIKGKKSTRPLPDTDQVRNAINYIIRPLIDTGQMRKAITYKIRKK